MAQPAFFLFSARLSIFCAGWISIATDRSEALFASVISAALAFPQATGSSCSSASSSRYPRFSTVRWRDCFFSGSHQLSTIDRLVLPLFWRVCFRCTAPPSSTCDYITIRQITRAETLF